MIHKWLEIREVKNTYISIQLVLKYQELSTHSFIHLMYLVWNTLKVQTLGTFYCKIALLLCLLVKKDNKINQAFSKFVELAIGPFFWVNTSLIQESSVQEIQKSRMV